MGSGWRLREEFDGARTARLSGPGGEAAREQAKQRGARLRASITDVDGAALDPNSIVVCVRKPDASIVVFIGGQIVRESAGIYHCETDIADLAGDYWQRWEVTGPSPAKGAEEKAFRVRASKVL